MSQSQDYGFCPNCGAVSRNGVCTSCGYKKRNGKFNKPSGDVLGTSDSTKTVFDYTSPENNSPSSYISSSSGLKIGASSGKNGAGFFAFASVAAIVIFSLVFLIYHSFRFGDTGEEKTTSVTSAVRGNVSSASTSLETSTSDDSSLKIEDWESDASEYFSYRLYKSMDTFTEADKTAYAEAADYEYWDEYDYYVYSDCIRTDLDYKIINNVWKYNGYKAEEYGEGYPEDAFIRFEYFTLESDTLDFVDEINDIIKDTTTYMCDYYDGFSDYLGEGEVFYGEGFVYVAYMSEDVLSLIFTYDGYFYDEDSEEEEEEDPVFYTMKSVNFDMKTGEILDMPKLSMPENELADKIIKDVNTQYNTDMLEYLSKDELVDAFANEEIYWFFNPMGVEFVYCFPDLYGYYSCTEDPNVVFEK